MTPAEEPPLREQLVEAREHILAQLDAMRFRTAPSGARDGGGPPDYRGVAEELEGQLHEIEKMLGEPGSEDP
jgi:hypothetical protein